MRPPPGTVIYSRHAYAAPINTRRTVKAHTGDYGMTFVEGGMTMMAELWSETPVTDELTRRDLERIYP